MHFGSFGATYGETGTGVPAHNGELEEQNNNLVYSVRKVVPSYTGYAMRIRRSSDNAEADISFDSANTISTSSVATLVADGSASTLGTFTSGTNAFVVDWYNQCRNTNAYTIGNTGTAKSFNTYHKLNLTGNFTITLELGAFDYSTAAGGTLADILHAVDTTSTAGDGILIENNSSGRGGYLKCFFNGSTITASGGNITGSQTKTFVVSRSGSTVDFSVNGSSQGTVTDSSAINVSKFTYLLGDDTGLNSFSDNLPINNFTVVDGSTTVFDLKDSSIFHANGRVASVQPKIVSSGAVMVNGNSDVALEFDGSNQYLSPSNFLNTLSDTDTGYLCYAEADSTTVGLDSVTASGAGTSGVNGTYSIYTGVLNEINAKTGSTVFNNGIYYLYQQSSNNTWQIDTDDDEDNDYYQNTATTDNPPTSSWTTSNEGSDPAPSLTLNTNTQPVLSQYQETFATLVAGGFYLGVDSNGWSAFLQSSTDGLNINSSGTSTITRPTILALGKPNSSSGTATFFRTDSTNGVYAEATDTFNQSIAIEYTGIGHANGSQYFDGHISEVIVLNGGSTDETRRAFNEQRNYWGF